MLHLPITGNVDVMEMLVAHSNLDRGIVRELLRDGKFNMEACDVHGNTVLHRACLSGKPNISVLFLLHNIMRLSTSFKKHLFDSKFLKLYIFAQHS